MRNNIFSYFYYSLVFGDTFKFKYFGKNMQTVLFADTAGCISQIKPLNAQYAEFESLYVSFVKLHDNAAFDYELVLQLRNMALNSCQKTGIVSKRANNQAANRFAKAGLTLRIHKLYAQAFKYILANLLDNFKYISLFFQQGSYNFFDFETISILKTSTGCYILKELFSLNILHSDSDSIFNELYSSRTDFTNMSFFYKRLSALAPVSAFHVKRVDKLRYKHSRGRSGRFENK